MTKLERDRAAWLKTRLPHQTPPEGEYDLWTIWGDRACGKTRAMLEEAMEWCRQGVTGRTGRLEPAHVAIFVRDAGEAIHQLLYDAAGVAGLFEDRVQISGLTKTVVFPNGSSIRLVPFARPDLVRFAGLTHAAIEDSDQATPDELDRIMQNLRMELKWRENPHIIMTCYLLPRWSAHELAGPRNHLSIAPTHELNPHLSLQVQDWIKRGRK